MSYINEPLTEWAIAEIREKYFDDVSLLIGHRHWKIPIDGDEVAFNYFIPETDRGYELSKTFIIDEIGYDLFPMSWERVEGLADINESLTTCLADGIILYAKDEGSKRRFLDLQKRLRDNLANPLFTYQKGLEKISTVMDLYKNLAFESSIGAIRKASGYVIDFLSQSIITLNGSYLQSGPENVMEVLSSVDRCPSEFISLCKAIVKAEKAEDIKKYCFELIRTTRTFFDENKVQTDVIDKVHDLEELAGWYEEGTYTFRRIYYYCTQKDPFNAFAWGYNFQQEFDYLEAELGLDKMDLMAAYHFDDLEGFMQEAKEIEAYIISVMERDDIAVSRYSSLEAFISSNR